MAIVQNNFSLSRLDRQLSPGSRDTRSIDEDWIQRRSSVSESYSDDDDDEYSDSGADSDESDLSELGTIEAEICQVGCQKCTIPLELYDLLDLREILTVDAWNNCLTEEERFSLAKDLPNMDQETFTRTLKELFCGCNFHFGSPILKLFDMLKGGLCEPRVIQYQQGLNFFQKREHYHLLQKYQNSMVNSLIQIKYAWENCRGFSIEERLQILNINRSQKSLMYEKMEDLGLEIGSSEREESGEGFWSKRLKGIKLGLKKNRSSYTASPSLEGRATALEPVKYGKQNAKGIFKFSGSEVPSIKELAGRFPSTPVGLETKSRQYASALALLQLERGQKYDMEAVNLRSGHLRDEYDSEELYAPRIRTAKGGLSKLGKKHKLLKVKDDFSTESPMRRPFSTKYDSHSYGRNKHMSQRVDTDTLKAKLNDDIAIYDYQSHVSGKKANYRDNPMKNAKNYVPYLSKGNLAVTQHSRHAKTKEEPISMDHPAKFNERNVRSKKWKMGQALHTGKNSMGSNSKVRSYKTLPPQMKGTFFSSDYKAQISQEKMKWKSAQTGKANLEERRSVKMFTQTEETESDSSESIGEEEDIDHFKGKLRYPSIKKASKLPMKETEYVQALDGTTHLSKTEVKFYPSTGKQRENILDPSYLHNYESEATEKGSLAGSAKLAGDDRKLIYKSGKNGHTQGDPDESLYMPVSNSYPVKKKRKGKGDVTYMDGPDESDCMHFSPQKQIDNPASSRKQGKRKVDVETGSLDMVPSELLLSEKGLRDVEPETKLLKRPFILITPTVHTGFSFSVIHLLSAVRVAMITPYADNNLEVGKHPEMSDGSQTTGRKHGGVNGVAPLQSYENVDTNNLDHMGQNNLPYLTVQEIVNRVRSNPGDPCILETQEPLKDLVRGVLKIFSSKTAPLGAKGWKTLTFYEKFTKCWSWSGPVPSSSSDHDTLEEETSSEAWGVPHKMLVKLVDAFANWLKSGQETLQQIGSLPAPPVTIMQSNLDEKERFRDLRAQKSLTTISPSSEEMREYFRKEEVLRYSVPDRAFSYTAADGRKSIVAPLRRCGGKPTSKARDHFMLKPDRPPHVTVLCLVRDAAARLPGNIGTRADVCTLLRDSQYIVEDVSDAQINQVVSGALDRLHYERDPCVQFDGDRKLWVYLHREREEEDFEDDGTSSTKKWKRRRQDATDEPDPGIENVACLGTVKQTGGGSAAICGLSSDVNVEPLSKDEPKREDLLSNDLKSKVEERVEMFTGLAQGVHQGHPAGWGILGFNSIHENNIRCQENSTNDDFDDQMLCRENPIRLLDATFS